MTLENRNPRVLMLWPDKNEPFATKISSLYPDLVAVETLYKKVPLPLRGLRRTLSELNLSTKLFIENWIDQISLYDEIIIDANIINRTVPRVLRSIGFKGRIIYWYWNPVSNCVNPTKIDRRYCELWSFSKRDCKRYNLKYNSTYYIGDETEETESLVTDFFFIGRDKGRYSKLMELKCNLEKFGFSTDFRIIRDNTSPSSGHFSDFMPYDEIIKCIKHSRAIVEILQEGQEGASLRVMEALFYNKKLISDASFLVEESFFSNNQFFLLPSHPIEEIKEFMKMTFTREDKSKEKLYFSFPEWLNRFNSNN